jgi:hypothetical protein
MRSGPDTAESLKIALVLVSGGCVDSMQLRGWVGAFEAICHRLYREQVDGLCGKAYSAIILPRAWEALPSRVLRKTWSRS